MRSSMKSCAKSEQREVTRKSSKTRKQPSPLCEGYWPKKSACWKLLRPLQREGVEFVAARKASALFFKQRLGKTYIAAGVIERLRPRRTLVIGPLTNIQSTWCNKLKELVPHVPRCHVTAKGRKPLLAALRAFSEGVFVLHFEAFCAIAKQLRLCDWDLIIVDESHRAKDRASLFSRRLAMMRYSAARKLILSGTPIDEEPQDLWGQFRFLDETLLCERYADFDEEFMQKPPQKMLDTLEKMRKGSAHWRRAWMKLRILKRKLGFDFNKLPQLIERIRSISWYEELPGAKPRFHHIRIKMYGEQRRVYRELERKGVVRLKDGTMITPQNKAVLHVKLRQITSGFIFDEEREVHWLGKAKMARLMSLLPKLPRPLPVFCLYTPEIEVLRQILPGRVGVLSGATKRQDRAPLQAAFQAGKLDYLPCQTRTGGVGIDLFRAKALFVLSSNYSQIDFDQLINRIRLPDQKDPVDIFVLTVADTLDDRRQNDVFAKSRTATRSLSRLKRRMA